MSLSIALFVSFTLLQAAPAGVHVWKAAEIASRGDALSKKLGPSKNASEIIATDGNRAFMVAYREGSGEAEWHETQADVFFITAGQATIVCGGTMVDAKTTAPGERRGPSIRDGVEMKVGPGDVVHIPAKTPHQMKLDAGAKVTYFVTKVTQ